MADGELVLKFDDETARRLKAAADAAGQPVSDYARDLIVEQLPPDDVSEDLRVIEEYERTGKSYSVEEAMTDFRRALDEQVAKQS